MLLTVEREYESQLGHTIWELERRIRAGQRSETLCRALVEAYAEQLRHLEERAEVPPAQRSQLHLQERASESVLLLPGERAGCDELETLGRHLHRGGYAALVTSLACRSLDEERRSPRYWQTCADEAGARYDILAHYATRIAIVGVGLSAIVALHLASVRRVSSVVALFPTLHAQPSWVTRLRRTLQRLVLRDTRMPRGWRAQREKAVEQANVLVQRIAVPLYVLVEDRDDRSEAGQSARVAHRLMARAATTVRVLPAGEQPSVRDLAPERRDEILAFVRQH